MKLDKKYWGIEIAKWQIKVLTAFILLGCIVACSSGDEPNPADSTGTNNPPVDSNDPPKVESYKIETLVTGLTAPQGIEIDGQGRLWVAEQGTGAADGRISVIDQNGTAHPFLTKIPSAVEEGSAGSAHHLLIEEDTLWAVVGLTSEVPRSDLIKLDISSFTPGDTPLEWNQDYVVADIAELVLNHNFANQTDQTNAYNLTGGPEGHIYIVDAAANAVVKYDKANKELSVQAELPTIANLANVGPPFMDAVPTGVIFEDGKFLVSAFVGFPFNPNDSRIFSVALDGGISTFKQGYTGAVDIVTNNTDKFLLEYGIFGSQGFQPNTGKVILLGDNENTIIAEDLNFPGGICIDGDGNLYITSMAGSIMKLAEE